MSQNSDLTRIITSDPIDATARRVTSKGISYDCPKKITQRHWDTAPATIKITGKERDLSGIKFGRFTVIGKLPIKGMWLVRCACSHYESRKSRAVLNPANNADCCDICRHQLFRKRERHFRNTGEDLDASDFI